MSSGAHQSTAQLADAAAARIDAVDDLVGLRELETELLGKRSELSALKSNMRDMDPDERRSFGAALNQARERIDAALAARRAQLEAAERAVRLEAERLDLTESIGRVQVGHAHVVTQTWERLEDVFCGMGYQVADGPEVETDWFNFEALNLPPAHPARSLWDTLYLDTTNLDGVSEGELVLRTHTSPVQVRTMLSHPPPIKIVAPGTVFRFDDDRTHSPMFHQIEGLYIDRGVTMADLKATLYNFVSAFFGAELAVRFRPSFFPFVEPGAEFDVQCPFCREP
ncbi:MAG: phenylalanine--tRNA ligase subunit alpha, partial [Microthrixaceae bacterium]